MAPARAFEPPWLREWADPAAHAHAHWWPALCIEQPAQALRTRTGRRTLAARLRAAVPLLPLAQAPRAPHWALAPAAALSASLEHAGWMLISPWVPRAIRREEIEALRGCAGQARYDAVFEQAPLNLWHDGVVPRPHAASAEALRAELLNLGLQALAQALAQEWPGLVARARLLLGPSLAIDDRRRLSIDTAALLAQMQAQPQ
jgi:hypothetical protein